VHDESKKVAPTNNILPFVSFPGFEIKDLFVHEGTSVASDSNNNKSNVEPTSIPPPAPSTNKSTAAVPPVPPKESSSSEKKSAQVQSNTPVSLAQDSEAVRKPSSRGGRGGRGSTDGRLQHGRNGPRSSAGTGEHLLKLRVKKFGSGDAPESVVGEFDFEKMLTGFNKKIELDKVATDNSIPDAVKPKQQSYKKEDFFDTLSCDMLDREEGRKTRMTASEERALNQDTFGAVAVQQNFRRRGGGSDGYHGRGGRGRGAVTGTGRGYYRGSGRGRGRHGGRIPQDSI
jgi:protein LSM14